VVGATCVCVSHVVLARQHAAGWQLLQCACCTPARMHPSWRAHRCRGRSAGAGRSPWCRARGAGTPRGKWPWGRARGWRSRTGSLQAGAGSTGEGSTVGAVQQAESDQRAGDDSKRQPHHAPATSGNHAASAPARQRTVLGQDLALRGGVHEEGGAEAADLLQGDVCGLVQPQLHAHNLQARSNDGAGEARQVKLRPGYQSIEAGATSGGTAWRPSRSGCHHLQLAAMARAAGPPTS
jgi:hypothetical protein